MLGVAMVTAFASSPGQTFGISVYNEPIRTSLGLSHSELALAYMLGTILGAMPLTYVGMFMDRHGLRRTLLVILTVLLTACVTLAMAGNWFVLLFAFAMLRLVGPGAMAFLSGNTLPFWFERRLGLVEGIRTLSIASAMAIMPRVNSWLIDAYDWRTAYLIQGGVIFGVLFPAFFFIVRNRPEDIGQQIDNGKVLPDSHPHARRIVSDLTLSEAIRTPAFWVVSAGVGMFSMILTAIVFHFVPILQDRGLTEADYKLTMSFFAICWATFQFSGGTLSDYVSARWLCAIGLLGLAISSMLLINVSTTAMCVTVGMVLGASQGTFFGSTHPLWARYFGRRHLGRIRGVVTTSAVASSSLGPFIAGASRDWFGSFDPALWFFVALPIPLVIAAAWVQPPVKSADSLDV